jgi:DNA-binding IclR family transcriptional regulator
MTYRAREERHADPRAPHGQRVMQALANAQFHTMTLAQLRLVTGLTTEQVLRVLDPMIEHGMVRALGDTKYQITQEAA